MCLAVPGRIVAIALSPPMGGCRDVPPADADLWRMATVDFGGVRQPVSLACLPEARLGDLVLVHVGLAICRVEESMAAPTEAATRRSSAAPPDPLTQPSPVQATVLVAAIPAEGEP